MNGLRALALLGEQVADFFQKHFLARRGRRGAAASAFFSLFMPLMIMNITKATMMKEMRAEMKAPSSMTAAS